jgi:fengycin family lipopeptide synthetase D
MVNKEPLQKVHDKVEFKIEYHDLDADTRHRASGNREERHTDIIERFIRPFDLSRAPSLRVGLIRLNENSHIFMVDMHHILSDFLSQGILIREIITLYSGGSLPELKFQYKDYSHWQNQQLLSGKIKKQEEYWLRRFAGDIPELEIPTDFPRPGVKSFEGSGKGFELNREVARRLMLLARKKNATLFMMYLAVTYVLLYKLGGQEDIVVGTIMAGRQHPDLENIIGPFINTLALRNYPGGNKSFLKFFHEVINNTLGAFDNQDYRFEELVQKVMVDRDISRNPLFDVVFAFGSREPDALPGIGKPGEPGMDTTGLEVEPFEGKRKNTAKFDLILSGTNVEEQCFFSIEYSTKLFKEETIQRYISYFEEITTAVADDPDVLLQDIKISSDLSRVVSDVYDERSEFDF